jgi:hypothetical protein
MNVAPRIFSVFSEDHFTDQIWHVIKIPYVYSIPGQGPFGCAGNIQYVATIKVMNAIS